MPKFVCTTSEGTMASCRLPSGTEWVVPSEAGATPGGSNHDPVKQIHAVMPQTTRKHFITVLTPGLTSP